MYKNYSAKNLLNNAANYCAIDISRISHKPWFKASAFIKESLFLWNKQLKGIEG